MLNRTIRIPVAEIIEGGTKQAFYSDLRNSLDLARRAANKAVTECVRQDAELMTGGTCPKLYTYPAIKDAFPNVAIVAASIGRSVEAKYKQERWQVSRGCKSICHYRSFPWPLLHNKSTKMLHVEHQDECITVKIKLLGGWWVVRLSSGSNFRDQLRGLRNALKIGDSRIRVDRKHKAIVEFSVEVAASVTRGRGTLSVSTHRDNLLVCVPPRSDVPYMINGDIARQWEAEHNKKQQRLRQDRKTGAKRRRVRESMNALSAKAQRRKSTLIHEAAARVVQFAKRRRLAKVEYDGTIKSFVRSFPWFELAEKIKYKCEDAGIAFVDVTQTVAEPDAQKPHIYFALGTITGRVKIGKTTRAFSDRKNDDKSFRSEPIVLLAVDNQPKTKLTKKEKHWHAVFAEHRVKDEDTGDEWFHGEPVIDWLREAEWIGNAGNLSQIAQFLDVSTDAVKSEPPPGSPRETIGHGA